MSKATIQMCMSTTGFGPQALRALPQQQYHAQTSPTTPYTSTVDADTEMHGYASSNPAGYLPHPQQQRRPVPRFDMNLKDLFSDDETDKRSFSRVSNQVNAMRPPPNPMKSEHMQPFTADLKISPQMRTTHQSQQQPFFASPNQQNNAFSTTTPPANPPMPSPYQIPSASLPYTVFSQQNQNVNSAYPDLGFSDLDFLDSFPSQGSGGGGGGSQDVGIGFGMGFGDGTHDWSDGNGLDLFDGFFFGKYISWRRWGCVKCTNGIQGLEGLEVLVRLCAGLYGCEAARRHAFV
jgi:hypothetical protein